MLNYRFTIILSTGIISIYFAAFAQEAHEHHEHAMGEPEYHMGGEALLADEAAIEELKKNPESYAERIREIHLEAFQFGFSPEEIVVRKGDIVRIHATSRDVTHGLYIKEYGINVPLKKGEVKEIGFIAKKIGEFDILCSVYCGQGHHDMKAKLIVKE